VVESRTVMPGRWSAMSRTFLPALTRERVEHLPSRDDKEYVDSGGYRAYAIVKGVVPGRGGVNP